MAAITRIITKIRSLIDDLENTTTDSFTYTTSSIFTLNEENALSISEVAVNGDTSGVSYTFSETTNAVTISSSLSTGDIVTIKYTYYVKYSDDDIKSYIEGTLANLSIYHIKDFILESGLSFYPYPTEAEENLIAIITAILIKPNYSRYSTSTLTVQYPRNKSKDEQIREVIGYYKHTGGHGIFFLG